MRLRAYSVGLLIAAPLVMPAGLQAQFGSGQAADTTGWAPISVGVRGGYDNELQGWMVGASLGLPARSNGSVEIVPSGDVTFLPGFEEYQGNVELVYFTGGRRGGLMAGGGMGIRNSVFGPDPAAPRSTVTTFNLMIGARIGTIGRFRPEALVRWIIQDEYERDPRHVALGVTVALW
jgi:hypothetical protein